jgi:hypothetical protein
LTRSAALIEGIDAAHDRVCAAERELFRRIAECDRDEVWRGFGARNLSHWLSMRYGLSGWKADRWIAASSALEALPRLSEAFESGVLGVDKVVELARFASTESESRLITWAVGVSCGRIRRVGDLALKPPTAEIERARHLYWWYFDDGTRFGLEAELPAAQGAIVAKALERLAEQLPAMPGEDEAFGVDARRADALVAMCSTRIAADPDPDRASVIVHVPLEVLASGEGNGEAEDGGVIPPETVRRLACNARVQMIYEDEGGTPVRVGRMQREPSAWAVRQIRYRDRECRFPGCGARRFTQAHHIVWWDSGGTTDLENLVLLCSFHHRLVHEHGWSISRTADGTIRWHHPDGTRYRSGPAPPQAASMDSVVPALA